MSFSTIVVIVLIVLLVGMLPHWGYVPERAGYFPSGGVGLVLAIVLVLLLLGRI
jgi:hypothetical protein